MASSTVAIGQWKGATSRCDVVNGMEKMAYGSESILPEQREIVREIFVNTADDNYIAARLRIPRQNEHRFHGKMSAHSTPN